MVESLVRVREESRRLQRILSPTACRGCRSLKIRCSRESPTCSRCQKKRILCVYPEPPNRRLLAARRNGVSIPLQQFDRPSPQRQEASRASELDRVSHTSNPAADDMVFTEMLLGRQSPPGANPFSLSLGLFSGSPHRRNSDLDLILPIDENNRTVSSFIGSPSSHITSEDLRSLPEREIGLLLIEVYFSRVFSASLLYDHKAFVECYCAGTLPKHTLLSTFAVSSLFLRTSPAETCGKRSSIGELESVGKRGREWAQWASELVLAHSDTPTLAQVCSCDVLSLYWFALGETERSILHATVSQSSFYLLDRKAKLGNTFSDFQSPRAISKDRVRWACFVKSCISEMVPDCHSFDLDTESIITRGPSQTDRPDPISLAPSSPSLGGYVDWLVWDETFSQTSVIYMLEVLRLWRNVKEFVRKLEKSTYQSCLSTFFELDSNLQHFYSSLPSEFKDDNLMDETRSEPLQRNAFFILSMYHLCLIFLHSSMVPALSLSTAGHATPPTIVKISSKTATSHAEYFAKMTCGYLNTTPDMAKVPSFVGYCAFVAGMVLSAVMAFTGLEKGQGIRRDGAICTLLLWELKVYWPTLQFFYQDLESHFCLSEIGHSSLLNKALNDLRDQDSPRETQMEDSSFEAFIAASCDLAYSPKCEFIHRPYSDDHLEHSSTAGTSPEGDQMHDDNGGRNPPSNIDPQMRYIDAINVGSSGDEIPPNFDFSTPSWSNIFIPPGSELFDKD
ncbi:hypothetical protein BGW36DRAFT_423547 [Talaromyces proteolyticus]|uniref:Zn(2)-C6 fungal-type domain-containing protein n=1 Tax=Talaromyces proteolyticus TaxID=1131652 RepID=A0AAD4L3M9_9EURO|nr:uncharacterized protein BGW36DRAFT_423547 [Talaromyces proteolyticus]KAH8704019.1 hypothetical protein BGW36DRAFT_423547 [Talaromyces proteolyticus]